MASARVVFARNADARYFGQGYELEVSVPTGQLDAKSLALVVERFLEAHRRHYGYVKGEDEAVQLVNLRLTATGRLPRPRFEVESRAPDASLNPDRACKSRRPVYFDGEFRSVPIYERSALVAGDVVEGPAVIEQLDSTTVLDAGQQATMDGYGNLIIDLPRRTEERQSI